MPKKARRSESDLKVHPHYAAWHTAAKCGKGRAAKVAPCHKYMWTLHRLGCGMLFDAAWPKNLIGKLSVPSKEATRHMMSKGFQNGISHFEKKIRPSSPISFHSFGNLKKVCKKFYFHVDAIHWRHMPSNFCRAAKLQCGILLRGIVWTHLNRSIVKSHFLIVYVYQRL